MAYASWSVVFGEQPTAAKWNILGTNDAYFDSLIGSGTAWASWTSTLANLTIGNGTTTSKYQQFGKTVFFKITIVLGSTSSVSTNPTFTLPVTSAALTATRRNIGNGFLFDTSAANYYPTPVHQTSTTVATWRSSNTTGNDAVQRSVDSTNPFTWATGDEFTADGFYEAA